MTSPTRDQQLQTFLESLLNHYAVTHASLDRMAAFETNGVIPVEVTNELQQVMQSIRANEPTYRAVLGAWKDKEFSPSDTSCKLREDVEHALESLVRRIVKLEQSAETAKSRLVPKLNYAAKGRVANQAYRQGEAYQ